MIERENKEKNQAGTKDLTSSSKFSACCVHGVTSTIYALRNYESFILKREKKIEDKRSDQEQDVSAVTMVSSFPGIVILETRIP